MTARNQGIFNGSLLVQSMPVTPEELANLPPAARDAFKAGDAMSLLVTFKGDADCIGIGRALGGVVSQLLDTLSFPAQPDMPPEVLRAAACAVMLHSLRESLGHHIKLNAGGLQ